MRSSTTFAPRPAVPRARGWLALPAALALALVACSGGGERPSAGGDAPCPDLGSAAVGAPRWRPGTVGAVAGFSPGGRLPFLPPGELRRELDGIAATGARWVRIDVSWEVVEGREGDRQWCATDRVVAEARKRGLDVVALVTYTPAWATASGVARSRPADARRFASFAADVARRYAPLGVHHYEVWNEPNLRQFWRPAAEPEPYARLLSATAAALREADPDAVVLIGGLLVSDGAGGNATVREMLEAVVLHAARSFDAVAVHPYTSPAPATGVRARLDEVRSALRAARGAAAPLWITEFGTPTGGADSVSAARQAADVTAFFREVGARPDVAVALWYSYRDAGDDPAEREEHFGVVDAHFVAKPAADAFARAMAEPLPAGRRGAGANRDKATAPS